MIELPCLMPSILVVDDEPGVRIAWAACCATKATTSTPSRPARPASAGLARRYDVILLDVWLPGIDGLTTLQRLRERQIDAQVVMISGHGTIETAVRAIKLGAFDFLEKPLSLEKTVLVVRNALRQRVSRPRTARCAPGRSQQPRWSARARR